MKLDLDYISNVIKDDFRNWKEGDTVLISSQTGTGKTTFIISDILDSLKPGDKILYLGNRKKLERDIKKALLKKNGELSDDIVNLLDTEELDKQKIFGKVTVYTYQALNNLLRLKAINLDDYRMIILDEAHFMFTDSSFNNRCYSTLQSLLLRKFENTIRVFITATSDEIEGILKNSKCQVSHHTYSTGRDYRYLNVSYFKRDNDILQVIKNDSSKDKWLIFVTSKKKGEEFEQELLNANVDVKFVHAKSEEDVIFNEQFPFKVLIATKFLDNGISINDKAVTNMVIYSYDKTTFIQECGRCRVNITNAHNINLYIPTLKASSFRTKINTVYKRKIDMVKLYRDNKKYFREKYHMDHDKVPKDLFYLDEETNEWQLNFVGLKRLNLDNLFANKMVQAFTQDEFAYVKEQLSWLELEETFNIENLKTEVVDVKQMNELESYLDGLYINKTKIDKDSKKELIEKIDLRISGKQIKSYSKLNYGIKELLKLPYTIITKRNNTSRYWIIEKNEK